MNNNKNQIKKKNKKRGQNTVAERLAIDKKLSREWAQNLLYDREDWIILDTETTGFGRNAEICQIAILDCTGMTLFDSLVKPQEPIFNQATKVHGITDGMVIKAPSFPDIYKKLQELFIDNLLIAYNAAFDTRILDQCCERYELPYFWQESQSAIELRKTNSEAYSQQISCAMQQYARWFGEYNSKQNKYIAQKLNGDHSAIGDCWEVLRLMRKMAGVE